MYDQNKNDMRPIFAIGLIMLITFLWIYLSPKPPTAPIPQQREDTAAADGVQEEKSPDIQKEDKAGPKEPRKIEIKKIPEQTEAFSNDFYTAVFSNHGATIKSLSLKKFRQKLDKDSGPVEMISLHEGANPLLWSLSLDKEEYSSDMPFEIENLDDHGIVFKREIIEKGSVDKGQDKAGAYLADMIVSYDMSAPDYRIGLDLKLINRTERDIDVHGIFKLFTKMELPKQGSFFLFASQEEPTKAIYDLNGKIYREVLEKQSSKIDAIKGDIKWLGFTDKYFMSALLPGKPLVRGLNFIDVRDKITFFDGKDAIKTASVTGIDSNVLRISENIPRNYEKVPYEISREGETIFKGDSLKILEEASGCYGKKQSLILDMPRNTKIIDNLFAAQITYPKRVLKANDALEYSVKLFAGPKDISVLKKMGNDMDKAIDLGDWIGPISRPLLYFLKWLYALIHNYGLAIIILTIVVRLLMYPLTAMQSKSMKKMQMLKPEIDKLKAKYGKDKETLNREMMKLWKIHKVNPLGGCFPLLLQLPIFFALYRVLYNAIELRHAPFMLWIKDLSDYDPYFVTPILMGVSFFLQQRMMPQSMGDEAQQKMMKWMFPIMFTGLMLFLPSGLVLYIFVSTILGIVQQVYNMRDKKPVEAKK